MRAIEAANDERFIDTNSKEVTGQNICGKKVVPPRPIDDDETCCVCCDNMKEDEDLSHCLYGCGR